MSTFQGTVPNRFDAGMPLPMTWTLGNPRRPASEQMVDPRGD